MKKIQEAQIEGKNVLVRIDMDIAIETKWTDGNTGQIVDDGRLRASIPTIKFLLEKGAAKIYIIGHLDRPRGIDFKHSLFPIANRLSGLLGFPQRFCKPEQLYELNEKIIIFENLRFNPGEEKNNPEFAKELAQDKDLFVQDAFATCHRSHASTVGIKNILPSYIGLSVQKEVENLTKLVGENDLTIIIGGRKAKDKLPVIENLASKTRVFLIGGVVANTFLKVSGYDVGKSLVETEIVEKTKEIFESQKNKIKLPVDVVISKSFAHPEAQKVLNVTELNKGLMTDFYIVDIGPETIKIFKNEIFEAQTIFINGNLGVSEVPEFSPGTREIAQAIVDAKAQKYAGGGDTTSFIRKNHLEDKFDFLSNGGGATLEFLAGKKLPGLEALK